MFFWESFEFMYAPDMIRVHFGALSRVKSLWRSNLQFSREALSCFTYAGSEPAICNHTFVRFETKPNFRLRSDSFGENGLELDKTRFADSHDWRNTVE